jgi:hypothetical protein
MTSGTLERVLFGASLFADGVRYYPDWSAAMLREYDDEIGPKLSVYYQAAKELADLNRGEWERRAADLLIDSNTTELAVVTKAEVKTTPSLSRHRSDHGLPLPLGDPLLSFRTFTGWMTFLQAAFVFLAILQGSFTRVASQAALLTFIVLVWSILPDRASNALYLRAFKNDSTTWPIRKAAQRALGAGFRLTGIRDPRRRWPYVLRVALNTAFFFHYNTPKFMNLEANDEDWQARLWRSFERTRCVLIDVCETTEILLAEIRLSYLSLGLERILFVGNDSLNDYAWQERIADWLPSEAKSERGLINVAVWSENPGNRKMFYDKVRSFATELPTKLPKVIFEHPLPRIGEQRMPEHTTQQGKHLFETIVGIIVGVSYPVLVGLALRQDPSTPSGVFGLLCLLLPGVAASAQVVKSNATFVIDCISIYNKVAGSVLLVFTFLAFVGLLLGSVMCAHWLFTHS